MARALLVLLALCLACTANAFVAPLRPVQQQQQQQQQRRMWQQQPQQVQELRSREALPLVSRPQQQPAALATTRGQPLYGIFGLGTPELVIIALVAGIVLGPDKIVDLARGVGKAAGELKAVPQEFEKGLKSGEEAAMKTKEELAKKKEEKKDE